MREREMCKMCEVSEDLLSLIIHATERRMSSSAPDAVELRGVNRACYAIKAGNARVLLDNIRGGK